METALHIVVLIALLKSDLLLLQRLTSLFLFLGCCEMAAVVKLRIILGENDSWKSIRELFQQIKGQCEVNDIWL